MSGGWLVVLDRSGRDVKRYELSSGLATLGSDTRCDIRIMRANVSRHHATVAVHQRQTVVRNVGEGETLVNAMPVSVAALRHGDVLTLGGRALRWDYSEPGARRPLQAEPALRGARSGRAQTVVTNGPGGLTGGQTGGRRRAGSASPPGAVRSPPVRLALEMQHRASMPTVPGHAGGKQVAIVQPQRRDAAEQNEQPSLRTTPSKRQRTSKAEELELSAESKRKSSTPAGLHNATKASMWIESRKSTPRKSFRVSSPQSAPARRAPPLRVAVLRRTQSIHKIREPLTLDHTKQAAIMLMTGHTPKSKLTPKLTPARRTPSYVAKKTPRRKTNSKSPRLGGRTSARKTVSILEITDSESRSSPLLASTSTSRRSRVSPLLPSPKKSAMKDPTVKKLSRKTESITFDLSNLENQTLGNTSFDDTDEDLTLHYSDNSSVSSPSPRKGIHSRSSRILEKSGVIRTESPIKTVAIPRETLTPRNKSTRSSLIVQKAMEYSDQRSGRYSTRTTKSLSDQSSDTTVASAYHTRTLSPRSKSNMETYSIVDLVSMDSETARSGSIYNSADSRNSSAVTFGTPNNTSGRKTRSTIDPVLVESSTPYVGKVNRKSSRARSSSAVSLNNSKGKSTSRRSKSLTETITPENTQKHISVNSTRISRASKSRSRLNDSDLLLITDSSHLEDESPRTSKKSLRNTKSISSPVQSPKQSTQQSPSVQSARKSSRRSNADASVVQSKGVSTPENRNSPEEVGTPMFSIQSLLDSSQSSLTSLQSQKKGRPSVNAKRKTIGIIRTEPKNVRSSIRSKSLTFTARRGLLRLSKESDEPGVQTNEKMVTPKSAVKLVQEAVKNKHSTAKKPQSKRSIIDNLDESDIVKQLFNSPVKRKLSRSMTEFSRKQLCDEDEAETSQIEDNTAVYTPERFISPIGTPDASPQPDKSGGRKSFRKSRSNNLSNIEGVKTLLRSPRTRKSANNDLSSHVAGVKQASEKSPRNRLTDVQLKNIFVASPKNDLTRVSGVKTLFQSGKKGKSPKNNLSDVRGVKGLFQDNSPANDLRRVSGVKRTLQRNSPRNDLSDVRGVKALYKRQSPENDLRRVSGVKRALQKRSPRNDLSDVRGVKRMFREKKQKNISNDLSGIEELFNESNASARGTDVLFDQLIGKPPIKAVYSKSFHKNVEKPKTRKNKSLQSSIHLITNNVEEWLDKELQKRLHKEENKTALSRALQMLATDTVEGASLVLEPRSRSSAEGQKLKKSASELYSAHTLPIKKRSLVGALADCSIPLKKRAVHSTPVKGGAHISRHAAGLGRISPIVGLVSSPRSEKQAKEPSINVTENQPKNKRKTLAKNSTEIQNKTTSPKGKVATPPKPRSSRANHLSVKNLSGNVKKGKASLAIPKKSPVMSPQPAPRSRRGKVDEGAKANSVKEVEVVVSPKKTRASRKQAVAKPAATPKKLRGRKNTGVVQKEQTPKKVIEENPASAKKTRSRKTTGTATKDTKTKKTAIEKVPEKSLTPKKTKGRKAIEVVQKDTSQKKDITPKKTRGGRKQVESVPTPKVTPKRNTRAKVMKTTVVVSKPSPQIKPQTSAKKTPAAPAKKSSRKAVVETETSMKRRKVESPKESPKPSKTTRAKKTDTKSPVVAKRGRKTPAVQTESPKKTRKAANKSAEVTVKATRGKKTASVEETTVRTRRKKDASVVNESNSRKRKTATEEVVPKKMTKTKASAAEVGRSARSKQVAEPEPAARGGRTRKTAAPASTSKKTASPVKEPPKKNTRGAKASPVKTTRAKAKPTEVALKAAAGGRSRRR